MGEPSAQRIASKMSSAFHLEQFCSSFFTFGDLISAGETAGLAPLENLPKEQRTIDALAMMASKILDPITQEFERPTLTYAFSGPSTIVKIKRNIAPRVDQHASFEVQQNGRMICALGGAAVDFSLEHKNSLFAARFVIENLNFDAIYFYGPDRPIHVSWSDSPRNMVVEMKLNTKHRRHFPVRRSPEKFLDLHGR